MRPLAPSATIGITSIQPSLVMNSTSPPNAATGTSNATGNCKAFIQKMIVNVPTSEVSCLVAIRDSANANAAAIAARFNLSHYSVQDARSNDPLQEVGVNADLGSAIFGLQPGGVTNAIVVGNNKLVFAALTGITPVRPAELPEVEELLDELLELEELLGVKVDLATPRELHRRIRDRVLSEATPI